MRERSQQEGFPMKASTKMALGAVALLVFCTGFCSTLAVAQMPTVDVTGVTALQSCPSNAGFYTGDPSHQPVCTTGTIGCAGTLPITPTWSITNPTATAGTVVVFTVDVTGVTALQSCPSNAGFYTGDPSHQPACTTGTIGCAGTLPITPTWSITNPTATAGTVVFFTGGGGESAASFPGEEQYFAPIYINANYQVAQISWPSDWEDVNNTGTGPNTPNIR